MKNNGGEKRKKKTKKERGRYLSWGEGWLLVLKGMDAAGPYLKEI